MTPLRPMSVAALLVMMAAPVMAAEASPQSPPAQAGEGGAAVPSPLATQPLDGLSATRERPLFSPTRRPQPPPPTVAAAPEPPPPPPAPPPDVALLGIVMDGDEAHAVVRAGPAEKIMRVGIGDDIGGWKVAQIEGRRLVLSLNGRIATFMMFAGSNADGAARAGAEAAGGRSQAQTQPQNQMGQSPRAPDPPSLSPRQRARQGI